MNREIKFRVYIKSTKQMESNDFLREACGGLVKVARMVVKDICTDPKGGLYLPLDDEDMVFMQYTGVKDTSGKDIYEGDIVVYNDQFNPLVLRGIVKFIEGSWIIDSEEDEDAVGLWSETAEIEILGNIHQNPDLIGI